MHEDVDRVHALILTFGVFAFDRDRLSSTPPITTTPPTSVFRPVRQVHAGLPFEPLHRVRELGTLPAMVRAGVGISIVPGLVASMPVPGLALVPLRPRVVRKLVMSGPPGREWHPAVTELVDSLPRV